jgi:hypothetical protein
LSWRNTSGRIFSPVSPKQVPNVFLKVHVPKTDEKKVVMITSLPHQREEIGR